MRLLAFLLIFLTSQVEASIVPPSPPPWSCVAFNGCNEDGICDDIEGGPIHFRFSEAISENRFFVEEFRGQKFLAAIFENIQQAKRFIRKGKVEKEVSMFFVESKDMSGPNVFRLYGTESNSNGRRFISDEYMNVGCHRQY